jgi:hypothetical protein
LLKSYFGLEFAQQCFHRGARLAPKIQKKYGVDSIIALRPQKQEFFHKIRQKKNLD